MISKGVGVRSVLLERDLSGEFEVGGVMQYCVHTPDTLFNGPVAEFRKFCVGLVGERVVLRWGRYMAALHVKTARGMETYIYPQLPGRYIYITGDFVSPWGGHG